MTPKQGVVPLEVAAAAAASVQLQQLLLFFLPRLQLHHIISVGLNHIPSSSASNCCYCSCGCCCAMLSLPVSSSGITSCDIHLAKPVPLSSFWVGCEISRICSCCKESSRSICEYSHMMSFHSSIRPSNRYNSSHPVEIWSMAPRP